MLKAIREIAFTNISSSNFFAEKIEVVSNDSSDGVFRSSTTTPATSTKFGECDLFLVSFVWSEIILILYF